MNTEETFVLASLKEFVRLWGSGCQSSFHLQCQNYQAWFKLESKLGAPNSHHYVPYIPPPPPPPPPARRKGPGRRQKDRDRAAAHRAKVSSSADHSPILSAESAEPSTVSQPTPTPAASEGTPATAVSAGSSTTDSTSSQAAAASATTTRTVTSSSAVPASDVIAPASVASTVASTSPTAGSGAAAVPSNAPPASSQAVIDAASAPPPMEFGIVCATAVFECCPHDQLQEDDLESLNRFILSENHLKQNIVKVNFESLSTRSFRNNFFTHTLSVELHVLFEKLWELPVTYVSKHLGKSEWKRSNGTLIKLVKINS